MRLRSIQQYSRDFYASTQYLRTVTFGAHQNRLRSSVTFGGSDRHPLIDEFEQAKFSDFPPLERDARVNRELCTVAGTVKEVKNVISEVLPTRFLSPSIP